MSTKKVVLPDKVYDAALTTDCTTVFFFTRKNGNQEDQVEFPNWFKDLLSERMNEAREAGRKEIREKMCGLLGVSD